jgi:excisionase family DNA binding protein
VLLGADEAAKILGIRVYSLYRLVREGVLPPGVVVRLGRHIRISRPALDAWIAQGGQPLPGGWRREAQ